MKVEILLIFIVISAAAVLILKKWILPKRGFTQLGSFILGEISLFCNRGLICENCPLSFGICFIGTTQRLAFLKNFNFYVTLLIVGLIGLSLGALSCGWACPVGFVQDFINASRIKNFKIPNSLRLTRYAFLFLFVLFIFLELGFSFLSKWGIVSVFNKFTIIGGAAFLILAFWVKRPFCRLLCPLGLIYGSLNKVSLIKVKLNKKLCRGCQECSQVCIQDVSPIKDVNGDLCVKCFSCQEACRANLS